MYDLRTKMSQYLYSKPLSMNNRKKRKALFLNQLDYYTYVEQLLDIALSMYEWEGMPETCDKRYMEWCLLFYGSALFFEDKVIGYTNLPFNPSGGWDVYMNPYRRKAYAKNGYHVNRSIHDSVIIWNNLSRTPQIERLLYYAERIWQIDRVIDVNVNAQKTPILVTADEKQRLTLVNLYESYEGNTPVIFGNTFLDKEALSVLKTDAPYKGAELYDLKKQLWNEALSFLGVPNTSMQKRERLITDEVARDMGGVFASQNSKLKAREEACEQINSMFNLNLSVKINDALRMSMEGGQEDGSIYSDLERYREQSLEENTEE